MADIDHLIGSDLTIGPTGDLAVITSDTWTQQRILRRLLTNPGDYIWQLTYGAGLASMVGSTVSSQQVAALIRSQICLEPTVSLQPEPKIILQGDQTGNVFATVSYQDALTGNSQTLSVPRSS